MNEHIILDALGGVIVFLSGLCVHFLRDRLNSLDVIVAGNTTALTKITEDVSFIKGKIGIAL